MYKQLPAAMQHPIAANLVTTPILAVARVTIQSSLLCIACRKREAVGCENPSF